MAKSTSYKSVLVKEDPKTSLAEAGVYTLTLSNGQKVAAFGHAYFPSHDRALHKLVLQYLSDARPDVVVLLGGMLDESAFEALIEQEDNYLHEYADAPEVASARAAGGFEAQILALGRSCGDFIKSFAEASGGHVIYIPSATHLSMPNEVRLMETIQRKKKALDGWSANHPDAAEIPSDPSVELPKKLSVLLGLDNCPNVTVTRYGAGVMVNSKMLFMVGDFRRRNAGDAAKVEWEQRGLSIVRGFDGKVASGWMTTPDHSLPGLSLKFHEFHEVGYLWDATLMGHLRDYDRRAPGFWTGCMVEDELFGQSIPVIRGNDGRRSFLVDDAAYTEEAASAKSKGEEITLSGKVAPSAGPAKPNRRPRG